MSSSTTLFTARYVVVPARDVVLPPITSKVVKYVIESSNSCLRGFTGVVGSFKPISMSMLSLNDRPLYSTIDRREPISVTAGTPLSFRLSIASRNSLSLDYFKSIEGFWRTPYGDFELVLNELEVIKLSYLGMDLSKFFKISFTTPAIITAKYMVPPTLRARSRELPERHRLMPQPSFIFSYLLRLWNSIAAPEERIPNQSAGDWEAYKLGRLADVTLAEVNYSVRPITAIVGQDSKGRLRRARGFIGWVIYESLSKKLHPIYGKLLALGTYLGIGRSRGIGFGQICVKNIELRKEDGVGPT